MTARSAQWEATTPANRILFSRSQKLCWLSAAVVAGVTATGGAEAASGVGASGSGPWANAAGEANTASKAIAGSKQYGNRWLVIGAAVAAST